MQPPAAMRYRTTRLADQDIIDVYVRGVRNFSAAQAERYFGGLIDCFELLAELLILRVLEGRQDWAEILRT